MKRFVKIVLIVIGVVVAAIIATAVALPLLVDPNVFRDEIAAAVESKTGREFTIAGDIELSVFPWLGVEINQVRLANAPGFGEKPMAEIEQAEVSVKLLPLLRQRIEVGSVGLVGMRLRLAKKASGDTNWDDLVAAFSAQETQAPPEPQTEGGFAIPELSIGAIEITDAAITYTDAAAGATYALTDVNASTGRLVLGEPFPVKINLNFASEALGFTSETTLVAELRLDLESQFYRFDELMLNVHAKGEAIPGGEQQVSLTGEGELDLQAQRLSLDNLLLQGAGVNITGNVDGSDLLATPSFNGHVTVQSFNPKALMQRLGMEPPATTDPDALTSAGLDAQFQATLESAKLSQVLLQIDESTLKGDARVENFSNPMISFTLMLDEINLDAYLPPESAEPAEPAEVPPAAPGSAKIELEFLDNLRLDGRVTVGQLTAANLHFQDATLAVTADDGVLRIQPLGANLYNGSLQMKSTVSAAGKRPTYALQGNLKGLALGPFLQDLVGTDKVAALANVSIDLTTTGNTLEEIKHTLDGTLSFELREGVFSGFDLSRILTIARNRLFGAPVDTAADGETAFSKFAASFAITDGLFRGGGMDLTTPIAKLGGDGSFNLVTNQLDYTVRATVPEGAEGEILEELAGITIPIKLSGNLFSPDYSLDLAGALKAVAEQKLQQEKEELKKELMGEIQEEKQELQKEIQKEIQEEVGDELGEKLGDAFGGALGGLLGGGDKKPAKQEPAAPAASPEPAPAAPQQAPATAPE